MLLPMGSGWHLCISRLWWLLSLATGDCSRGSVPSMAQLFPVVLVRAGWKELTSPRAPPLPTGSFSPLTQSCSWDQCRGRATRGCGLAGGDDRWHRAALPKEVPRQSRAKPPRASSFTAVPGVAQSPAWLSPKRIPPCVPAATVPAPGEAKTGRERGHLSRGQLWEQAVVVQIGCNGQQEEGTEVFVALASCCRIERRSAGAALPSSGRKKLLVLIKYLGFVFITQREGRCIWELCYAQH